MVLINQKYPEDIDDHYGIRNIIDLQYEKNTKSLFMKLTALYVLGFAVPFTL